MATLSTPTAANAWRPDLIGVAPADAVPGALILETTTVAGSIEGDEPVVRVPFVDDDDATIVAEAATIAEADPTLSEVAVGTVKIAQLLKLSYELYSQQNTASLLSGSVQRAIIKKADQLLVQGDTTASVTGLADATGVLTGDAVSTSLDPLIDLIAGIEGNGGQATHIVAAPDTWASLRKLKTATSSNESLLGAGTDDSERRLLSLPVLVSGAVPTGQGLILDRTAIVSAAGQVRVATSDQAYFASDSVGLRATWRIGFKPMRGERLAKFAIAAEG